MSDDAEEALVDNAASAQQVRKARTKEKQQRERDLADLRALLALPAGRRTLWRFLEHCRTFGTVMDSTDALTNYNAGRQDVGHYLLDEITQARTEALVEMMTEAHKEKQTS